MEGCEGSLTCADRCIVHYNVEGCRFPTLTCDRLTGFFHRHSTGRPVFSTDMWQFIGLPCLHATGRLASSIEEWSGYGIKRHSQQYYIYIVAVSFISG